MERKKIVQIIQVTDMNIDRKIIKNWNQEWEEKLLFRYFK